MTTNGPSTPGNDGSNQGSPEGGQVMPPVVAPVPAPADEPVEGPVEDVTAGVRDAMPAPSDGELTEEAPAETLVSPIPSSEEEQGEDTPAEGVGYEFEEGGEAESEVTAPTEPGATVPEALVVTDSGEVFEGEIVTPAVDEARADGVDEEIIDVIEATEITAWANMVSSLQGEKEFKRKFDEMPLQQQEAIRRRILEHLMAASTAEEQAWILAKYTDLYQGDTVVGTLIPVIGDLGLAAAYIKFFHDRKQEAGLSNSHFAWIVLFQAIDAIAGASDPTGAVDALIPSNAASALFFQSNTKKVKKLAQVVGVSEEEIEEILVEAKEKAKDMGLIEMMEGGKRAVAIKQGKDPKKLEGPSVNE